MSAMTFTTGLLDQAALEAAAEAIVPLPAATARLISLANDPRASLASVVETVQYDPGLASALLRQANSAYAMAVRKVTDVHDAIVRLGMNSVVSIAMRSAVAASLDGALDVYRITGRDLYRHSVLAAVAADVLRTRNPGKVPSTSPTVALLHDVGKLVISRALGERAVELVQELAQADGVAALDVEQAVFGLHHGHAGAFVINAWKLPTSFLDGIVNHHGAQDEPTLAARAVQLSDVVAHTVDHRAAHADAPWQPDDDMIELCRVFGVPRRGIDDLVETTALRYEEITATLTR